MIRYRSAVRLILAVALAVLVHAQPAVAGPPILHHPFAIGAARSLPWAGSSLYWYQGQPGYDVQRLVADTEALLTPSMPVVVRMETIRRAAIYASLDADVAGQLLFALQARAAKNGTDPLALFDAGYLSAAFRQIAQLDYEPQFRERARRVHSLPVHDAEKLIERALALRPDDAAMAFGAAIIAAGHDGAASRAYAARARLGVGRDPLLAANMDVLH